MAKQTITLNTLNAKIDGIVDAMSKLVNAQTALTERVNALEGTHKAKPVSAKAKATAKPTTKGKGKATVNEVDKTAKAKANAEKRLAYKQDKRSRNMLTKAENKLVAAQMRERGENPADKQAWEKAKKAYIKANPLV